MGIMQFLTRNLGMVLLCLVVTIVTACGTSDKKIEGGNQDEIIELDFWGWVPFLEQWSQIEPEFNKLHPNIKVNYNRNVAIEHQKKLAVAVQGGTMPDVFGLQMGAFLKNYESMLEPLEPFAKKAWGDNWKQQFKPNLLDRVSTHEYKALPTGVLSTPYIAYNEELFKKVGVEPPNTYEELKDVIQKFEQAELPNVVPRLGFAGGDWGNGPRDLFYNLVNQISPGKILEADSGRAKFTDVEFIQATEHFQKFYADKIFQEGNLSTTWNPDLREVFKESKQFPMVMIGQWFFVDIINNDDPNTSFGLAPFPSINGGKQNVLVDGDPVFGISKDSKNKEAAWKLIEFLTTGNFQEILSNEMNYLPVKNDMDLNIAALRGSVEQNSAQVVMSMIEDHTGGPRFIEHPEIEQALFLNLQKVATNELSPQEAMEEVQKVAEDIIR